MVRAVCKNDKKVCGSFVAYTVLILNRRWITPAIFFVLTVATGVLGIFFPAALTLFLLLLAATALLSVAIVLKLRNTVKKLTAGQFAEIVNTYVFGEDRFQIETKIGKKPKRRKFYTVSSFALSSGKTRSISMSARSLLFDSKEKYRRGNGGRFEAVAARVIRFGSKCYGEEYQ